MIRRLLHKPVVWALLVVVLAGGAFGLYWFQPWKLFTSKEVNEAAPEVVAVAEPTPTVTGGPTPAATSSPKAAAVLLAEGKFITHEHDTSGTAQLVRLPDGRHQLVLRNLATSDGPDLRIWITDQPVISGVDGWRVFDDGKWVELGRLKGTHGTQVYNLPADADPADFTSISIWCKRFAVSFGAAPLTPA